MLLIFTVVVLLLTACTPGIAENPHPVPGTTEEPLVDDFSITTDELTSFAAGLTDREVGMRIVQGPHEFLILMRELLSEPAELFLIADKEHTLPAEYIPEDLVPLTSFPIALNREDLRLRAIVMPDLLAMDQAAKNEGLRLLYSSSYRSFEYQDGLFKRNVELLGQKEAERVSARPGTSQHQLGTTVDFGSITDAFAATPEGRWLKENATRFGFSLSYPEDYEAETGYVWESWHYRYLGRPATSMIDRYFDGLQHRFLTFLAGNRGWFEARVTVPGK